MQGGDKIQGRGARSTFLQLVFAPGTYQWYANFLREQGFRDFLQIPPFIRYGIGEALVPQFHIETSTFHLSYGEYAILPLDRTAILGIRFGGLLILTNKMTFEMARERLGIPLPLTANTRGNFEPTASPQICIKWLQSSIPWDMAPTDVHLHQFFL